MTGWNLPPGCNVRDLPGNTREEEEAEVAFENLCKELETEKLIDPEDDEEWSERLVLFILVKMGEAYSDGYCEGAEEESAQRELTETEKAAEEYFNDQCKAITGKEET